VSNVKATQMETLPHIVYGLLLVSRLQHGWRAYLWYLFS